MFSDPCSPRGDILKEYKGNSDATCQAPGILTVMEKLLVVGKRFFSITDTLSSSPEEDHVCYRGENAGCWLILSRSIEVMSALRKFGKS